MTSISLSPPIVKGLNTVEEPKVGTALKTIEQYLNLTNPTEGVGGANIVKESIKENNLELAVQILLNKAAAGLTLVKQAGSVSGTSGNLYLMETNATTLTLPEPTINRQVGSITRNTIAESKMKVGTGKIFGDFLNPNGVETVTLLENQHMIIEADGTNWRIISGEGKRTQEYTTQTLTKAEAEVAMSPSATRPTLLVVQPEEDGMVVEAEGVVLTKAAGIGSVASITFELNPGQKWKGNKKCHVARLSK